MSSKSYVFPLTHYEISWSILIKNEDKWWPKIRWSKVKTYSFNVVLTFLPLQERSDFSPSSLGMYSWSSCTDEFCDEGSIIESEVINCQLYLGLHFLQHGSERYGEENPALFNLESGRNLICLNHISPRERTETTLWTTEFNFQKKKLHLFKRERNRYERI